MTIFNTLLAVFKKVPEIRTVFADGEIQDTLHDDRHLHATPWVECVEDNIDLRDFSSTDVNRRVTATCRVVMLRERDNIRAIKEAIEDAFVPMDEIRIAISEAVPLGRQYWQMAVNATYYEAVPKGEPVLFSNDKSILMDGVDEYVGFNGSLDFDITAETRTFSVWIKPTTTSGTKRILSNVQSGGRGWELYRSGGGLRFIYGGANGGVVQVEADPPISSALWQNYVVTVGGNTASDLTIYRNGVLQTQTTLNDTAPDAGSSSPFDLTIGNRSPGGAFYFDGNIDEVSIWNTEFSQIQIDELYNAGNPSELTLHSKRSNLIFWARCGDEDTFPTLSDVSGGLVGTMTNMEAGDIVSDSP